ncbi:hypothetical protein C808_01782 [Lachnospiraceae bacterium M18-1]|nr:hypothetical protein C808_01782 [Lachnospiraceae bacterium M18-1]
MGLLAGKTKLRRIVRWSKRNLAELQRHLPFPNGVPSVSTMSRMLVAVDEEMVALALTNWIGEIYNTRGIHIAIDGKGLRAAARKVREEKTPYILNAIDVASKLVIGQLVIQGKANEMTAIPELMELLEIKGSTITIDAIGATGNILNAIHDNGWEFVLQVKKNCPELYAELMRLFEGLSEDRENDPKGFQDKYGNDYSYQLLRGSISFPMVEVWRHTQEEIKRFKKMSNAVLFASGSCWEGVDFPGDMVSSLIIVRLPFSVPDPVQEANKTLCLRMNKIKY